MTNREMEMGYLKSFANKTKTVCMARYNLVRYPIIFDHVVLSNFRV